MSTSDLINLLQLRESGGVVFSRHCITRQLEAWAEQDVFTHNCNASYIPLPSNPRSTIATAFSHDGSLLASTHGDHTVKVFDMATGQCIHTLYGHPRTPWVVRWHPSNNNVLATGSLNAEVRVWNLATGSCIESRRFSRPIASLAFMPTDPNVLAIASGHKLYMWKYTTTAKDTITVFKGKRSLRAVHFHPQGGGLLITAELMEATPTALLTPATTTADAIPGALGHLPPDDARTLTDHTPRHIPTPNTPTTPTAPAPSRTAAARRARVMSAFAGPAAQGGTPDTPPASHPFPPPTPTRADAMPRIPSTHGFALPGDEGPSRDGGAPGGLAGMSSGVLPRAVSTASLLGTLHEEGGTGLMAGPSVEVPDRALPVHTTHLNTPHVNHPLQPALSSSSSMPRVPSRSLLSASISMTRELSGTWNPEATPGRTGNPALETPPAPQPPHPDLESAAGSRTSNRGALLGAVEMQHRSEVHSSDSCATGGLTASRERVSGGGNASVFGVAVGGESMQREMGDVVGDVVGDVARGGVEVAPGCSGTSGGLSCTTHDIATTTTRSDGGQSGDASVSGASPSSGDGGSAATSSNSAARSMVRSAPLPICAGLMSRWVTGNAQIAAATRTTNAAHPSTAATTPPPIIQPRPDQNTTPAPLVQALERTSVSPGALGGTWGGPGSYPRGGPVGLSVRALSHMLQHASVDGGVERAQEDGGVGDGGQQQQRSVSSGAALGGTMTSYAAGTYDTTTLSHTTPPPYTTPTAPAAPAAIAADPPPQQEQPCRVCVKVWRVDINHPENPLEEVMLTVHDVMLCSEMGVHFAPDGNSMALCVARSAPTSPPSSHTNSHTTSFHHTTTPQHPPTSHASVVYELQIQSTHPTTMGTVLSSRRVRAAHCMTSLQVSPGGNYVLMSYGRRHISLLRTLVEGSSIIPVHTVLEVYRLPDLRLVRVLPSAEDEVNAACFHPVPGGGLAYGTKEGRLRVLRHEPFAARRRCEEELTETSMTSDASDEDHVW